jgi:hypothetical protein
VRERDKEIYKKEKEKKRKEMEMVTCTEGLQRKRELCSLYINIMQIQIYICREKMTVAANLCIRFPAID